MRCGLPISAWKSATSACGADPFGRREELQGAVPSDEECCAWARAQRTVRHFLGRGKSQSEDVDLPKINAELFAKIRTDKDGPEFDNAEAGMVIGRIERCAVASVEHEGQ